jgi:hypothetical protein
VHARAKRDGSIVGVRRAAVRYCGQIERARAPAITPSAWGRRLFGVLVALVGDARGAPRELGVEALDERRREGRAQAGIHLLEPFTQLEHRALYRELERTPVCGCDGMTYTNRCAAEVALVRVEHEGERE